MAKKESINTEPYIVEDAKSGSKFRNWITSRPAKITAISLGAALALGVAFTGGALAGRQIFSDHEGPGFANDFDRDGDHRPPFDGAHPPKPGHGPDGDRQGGFTLEEDQSVTPNSTSTPTTTP